MYPKNIKTRKDQLRGWNNSKVGNPGNIIVRFKKTALRRAKNKEASN